METGQRLADRYRLDARLAHGATATVWQAVDERLDRPVAVKILHQHLADDPELAERFAAEARTAATVTHPCLVAVYDTVRGPPPAIVLELVGGPDLRQMLDHGPLAVADIYSVGHAIADGLEAAHRVGLVHRDVKPANIVCTPSGAPKLADFGIATAAAGDRTATGVVLGTAKYLAPEQVRGERLDPRTDVYALCAVLYEALCGRPPFEREGDLPTALARLEETPAPVADARSDAPGDLCEIVMRGLARDPARRWPSAGALREALRRSAQQAGVDIGAVALANRPTSRPISAAAAPTGGTDATLDRLPPARPQPSPPATTRRARQVIGRAVFVAVLGAIAWLGWQLVTRAPGIEDATAGSPVVVGVRTFDPEGTGPPGEHDQQAPNLIDGSLESSWPTERYEDRSLGAKSGVGVVLELQEVSTIDEVTIATGGSDWAVAIHVGNGDASSIDEWGPPASVAASLDSVATIGVGEQGRAVLIWFTDLGSGPTPIRLEVAEITIR